MTVAEYYVAECDKKTHTVIPFSRVECESGLDAGFTLEFLTEQYPTAEFVVGYVPGPGDTIAPHICRGCNCQFDRRAKLVNDIEVPY